MKKVQHMSEFKEDSKDAFTLLSRVFGYLVLRTSTPRYGTSTLKS